MGAALLLLAGCEEKGEVFYQNPYRIIVDYQPSTFTIDGISGNVTPDGDYNWITSNGGGSFTVRRNTSGRSAEPSSRFPVPPTRPSSTRGHTASTPLSLLPLLARDLAPLI